MKSEVDRNQVYNTYYSRVLHLGVHGFIFKRNVCVLRLGVEGLRDVKTSKSQAPSLRAWNLLREVER